LQYIPIERSTAHTTGSVQRRFNSLSELMIRFTVISNRLEELKNKRWSVTGAEITRQEIIGGMRNITEILRSMDTIGEFDEELCGMLVERIKVINLVQVEFMLRSEVGVTEII
jgi:site-specific DNA recombinase